MERQSSVQIRGNIPHSSFEEVLADCIEGEKLPGIKRIFQWVVEELKKETYAAEDRCLNVARNILIEVSRMCSESDRIQASGDIENWAIKLAKIRLQQCLHYYHVGARKGQMELHSALSAIIYRYMTPSPGTSSYEARRRLIEDFLQGFYAEAWKNFRKESQLSATYRAETLLELAQYMAFTERYAKRHIPLPGHCYQQLIVLRAQSFLRKQSVDISLDFELADDETAVYSDYTNNQVHHVSAQMVLPKLALIEDPLHDEVVKELKEYLEERQQNECVNYFALLLEDKTPREIDAILGLTPRQRDYLQQRFKYHLMRFAFYHKWELVHEWLEADLDNNLGMTSHQWQAFEASMNQQQLSLLRFKQQKLPDSAIAQYLNCSINRVQRLWYELLNQAWMIRNSIESRTRASA